MSGSWIRDQLRGARDAGLSILVRSGRKPEHGSLTILTYHRVLPRDQARAQLVEPGMYVTPQTFARHCELIQQYFKPVDLQDWLENAESNAVTRDRHVAVTFDDGWRDNYDHAKDVVCKQGIPATVFVVPDAIDGKLQFWPDRFTRLMRHPQGRQFLRSNCDAVAGRLGLKRDDIPDAPSAGDVSRLIAQMKALPDETIAETLESIETTLGHSMRGEQRLFLNWSEIDEMASTGYFRFGSHSHSHRRLDTVDDEVEARHEVGESRRLLRDRLGAAYCDVFCYPNGNIGELAESLVRQEYRGACTVVRGTNSPRTDEYRLMRCNVHEDATARDAQFLANLIRH